MPSPMPKLEAQLRESNFMFRTCPKIHLLAAAPAGRRNRLPSGCFDFCAPPRRQPDVRQKGQGARKI